MFSTNEWNFVFAVVSFIITIFIISSVNVLFWNNHFKYWQLITAHVLLSIAFFIFFTIIKEIILSLKD